MRMLQPSPGEIADRTTILELKIEATTVKGLPTEHLEQEHKALYEYVVSKYVTGESERDVNAAQLRTELFAVNRKLWTLEDEVRSTDSLQRLTNDEVYRLAEVCKLIADLNDCRSRLVGSINALFNIPGEEKIYQCTQN